MSSSDLTRYMAYWRIDPRPDPYTAAAVVAYWMAAIHGNKNVDLDTFVLRMPVPETPAQRQLRFLMGFRACPRKSRA
ncbi:hypothetical protein [Paludisphaera sp.]|uniref:hypothetical protein n=1 Tax=Paludisphaera sp. TaxID=2017432 RepID=UPI00301C662D